MRPLIRLGMDLDFPGHTVSLEPELLSRHLHLIGATGSGKTVAIHTLTRPLMMATGKHMCSLFVFDLMGNLSFDLLRWIASTKCPAHVRERLVYLEPANNDYVVPFNPLRLVDAESRYYHVSRAVDLILRAWAAQDLSMQPRLMQWSYKAVSAMATLKLPLAMTRYLLHPGTPEHNRLLELIPEETRYQWTEILAAKGGQEAVRILESTRNRFEPLYEAPQARRMFATVESHFDVERFIRERRIVIINLAKLGALPKQLGSTIGALMLNEVFETVFNMATVLGKKSVEPTYCLMDEFQQFCASPDIEDALPTCRQMGLRLLLAHQSFSQLKKGDIDLTNMIFQARNRLMFANSAEDADLIANELATLTFNKMAIKDERIVRRQLIAGYRTEWLKSRGTSYTDADSTIDQRSVGYSRSESEKRNRLGLKTGKDQSQSRTESDVSGGTRAKSVSNSESESQQLVPIHEEVEDSNITYLSFDEHRLDWMKTIRQLKTGHAFGKFVDDDRLYRLLIDHRPVQMTSALEAAYQELLQRNYEQEFFISKERADQLAEQERLKLLAPQQFELPDVGSVSSAESSPFRTRKPNSETS
ncbi:MAG: type IV secretory system conjugative DNA transfer family protein [Planctomycetaceae bacterium]